MYTHVYIYITGMLVPVDTRRRHHIPWTEFLGTCQPHDLGAKNPHYIFIPFFIIEAIYPLLQETDFIFISDYLFISK